MARVMFTPVTVLFVILILLTQALVRMVRFGRFSEPRRIGWMYATEAELRRPSSGLYAMEKNPTPCCKLPVSRISSLKSLMIGISIALEQAVSQSRQTWFR